MSDFSIREMLVMQQTLQEKYKDKWETIRPEAGKHRLLWMIGEIGEVVDIIKKMEISNRLKIVICENISLKKWQMF